MKYANHLSFIAVTCVLAALPFVGAGCVNLSAAENSEQIAPASNVAESIAPSDGTATAGLTVTMNELGKTIRLGVGDGFLLSLPSTYEWTSQTSDASVLATDFGIRVAYGARVVFKTFKPGKVTLAAQGDAPCQKALPACTTPPEFFKVDFIVTP